MQLHWKNNQQVEDKRLKKAKVERSLVKNEQKC